MEETDLNTSNVIEPGQAIGLIKIFKWIIKSQHKRVIVYIAKEGEIVKKLRMRKFFLII